MPNPGDYAERATTTQDPTFVNRVVMASLKRAVAVQTEAGSGGIHDKRVKLAGQVIDAAGQVDMAAQSYPLVVRRFASSVAATFTFPGQNPTNEADLDAVVNTIWNALAGVMAGDT